MEYFEEEYTTLLNSINSVSDVVVQSKSIYDTVIKVEKELINLLFTTKRKDVEHLDATLESLENLIAEARKLLSLSESAHKNIKKNRI